MPGRKLQLGVPAVSGDGSKCTTQGRLKVYHPEGVGV